MSVEGGKWGKRGVVTIDTDIAGCDDEVEDGNNKLKKKRGDQDYGRYDADDEVSGK